MTLDPLDIAHRYEAKQASAAAALADAHLRLGPVVVAHGGPGSYLNRASGFLPGAPPTDAELDALLSFFSEHGEPPRLEFSAFMPAEFLAALSRRGLSLHRCDHLLVRALPAELRAEPPEGVRIQRVDPSDEPLARAFAYASEAGFAPDGPPAPAAVEATLRALRLPETDMFCALAGEELVATVGSESSAGFTALFGASVRPSFRRRGLHQALMAARLRRASERGSAFATVSCTPGGPTDRNARRLGFALAYVRLSFGPAAPERGGGRQ